MYKFEIWSPETRSIDVQIGPDRYPLEKLGDGWWAREIAGAGAGTDYLFVVNGEEPGIPDPRSRWQPHGVHGPSRIFDPAAYRWTATEWRPGPLASAVLYEIHLGTVTSEGTFAAAESRLDYLKNLGITHVELMPVNAFSGKHGWGYDGVALYAPHAAYGTPSELQHLVDTCHGKGLAVLLDVVYNHLGPAGNYLARFAPYFTSNHHTPWGDAVNLEDAYSDQVRRFFIDNALMWLRDYRFDGLRLDAVHAFVDRSAIHFLEQLADDVRQLESHLGRSFVVIAESDLNDPRLVHSKEAGGFGLDAQWSDDFHHALIGVLTGEQQGYYEDFGSLADLAKSLQQVFVYNGNYSQFRKRNHGRPVVGLPGNRFLGYAQNHDQIGNRARGERLVHLTSSGRAKIAAALVLTSPFVPLLFQGEEFGASAPFQYFTDHEDLELGRSVSEGRKAEFTVFGWNPEEVPDPQDKATFQRSKIDWAEIESPEHASLLNWHEKLIQLRRKESDLMAGDLSSTRVCFDEAARWLTVRRGRICVVCNLGIEPARLPLNPGEQMVLASDPSAVLDASALHLPPDSVAILKTAGDGHAQKHIP